MEKFTPALDRNSSPEIRLEGEELNFRRLVRILQMAYSGEMAAAYAYRGHWHSVKKAEERARICQIEQEEWHHRSLILGILEELGSKPERLRELKMFLIGRTLGLLCYLSGWFIPMYGAGRLEKQNVREYENAAEYASKCGKTQFLDCLLSMAELEWDHEVYFREKVLGKFLLHLFPLWTPPGPKALIREKYQAKAVSQ